MPFLRKILLFLVLTLPLQTSVRADVSAILTRYDLDVDRHNVALIVAQKTKASWDSLMITHGQLNPTSVISAIVPARHFTDKTVDFYLLMFLIVLLGLIRLSDPRYFQSLWHAFKSPSSSSRQLKEKLQGASLSNLLMNIFFTMSAAAYGFFIMRNFMPQRTGTIPPSLLLIMLMGGMMAIYAGKYAVIKFSGWAFRVKGITEHYLFNVFLVNKILAIILLPIIVLLAFADPAIAQPALILSFLLILFLFVNRYLRSWQVFGSFFQYSKFHFFTYLCASELLPLAVLMKLLVRGLMY